MIARMESRIDLFKREQTDDHPDGDGVEAEYLTTSEVASRLRWSKRTVRAKIRAGVFRRGEHFFQPPGCQCRWKWSVISKWLEGERSSALS
jgi:excisionase family DNA binding protein